MQKCMSASVAFRAMVHIPLPRILTRACPAASRGYGSSAVLYGRGGSVRNISCDVTSSLENAGKDSSHSASDVQFLGSRREAGSMWLNVGRRGNLGSRQFWILPPAQMGRRSSKIATKKGAQDKKKAKLYGKMGKQIQQVVKEGGPSPAANAALAQLLQQAKDTDVPREIIDRNMKKASEKGQQDFVELTYEVYGYGGVGLVLEVLTDNHNRAAATIRDVVKKSGAKMADSGSVLFNFKRAGVIYVKADKVEADDLLLAAMDAGAEDVIEPSAPDEEDDEDDEEKYLKVITPMDQFASVRAGLQEAGIPFDADISGLELIPVSEIEVDDEAVDLNKALMDKLLELDDVDAVFSNQK
ncbi:hypothetical protein KC19_9G148300 [Ceratodon purpureus]|uniref:Transcriptional regulatory protein n=1 Tax=Ceratodon purpureus TaxID=3225 RepID=A0A8T0GVV7_CERPU|nr:hypothetical protein KC19_9G148300 [Ceratodon purpureus]